MRRPAGPRVLVTAVAAAIVLVAAGGCELRERREIEEAGELPPARVPPPPELRERQGPVFAPPDEAPLVVGDDFWAGPGTVGYELVATFLTHEAMLAVLDPRAPVGHDGEREWLLAEILVAVDYRGVGPGAVWRVVGPPEIVEPYVDRLEGALPRRAPITSLGVLPVEVRYCCPLSGPGPAFPRP